MISSKIITAIAYAVIGSEVVKDSLTMDNARKVGNAIGRAATTTHRSVRSRVSTLRNAVAKRKAEIIANRPPF